MSANDPKVLHVVVGHSLPIYFLNAVRSVRRIAPDDDLLVVDNASPEASLRDDLRQLAAGDPHVRLLLRSTNELAANGKVGGLYLAYAEAFEIALSGGYDLVHLLQSDMQMLWWGKEFTDLAMSVYDDFPECVNIHTMALSRDKALTDELVPTVRAGIEALRGFGLTDTGLYHLGRWRETGMHFHASERSHATHYSAKGHTVLCHPWPCDAQIPWPAVIRRGRQRGREVATAMPLLLRPLTSEAVATVRASPGRAPIEDVCLPWGWLSLSPMWMTGLESIDYFVLRYRDVRRNKLKAARPRLVGEGRGPGGIRWLLPHRPSLLHLLVGQPLREVQKRLHRN